MAYVVNFVVLHTPLFFVCLRLLSVYQVAEGGERVVEEHTRAGPAHNGANLLAHLGLVAVYRAPFARTLRIPKLAGVESAVGILDKFDILCRRSLHTQFVAAIQPYHFIYYALLAFDALAHILLFEMFRQR